MGNLVKNSYEIIFTAMSNIAAGDIVAFNGTCGVAVRDMLNGEEGVAYLRGIYEFPISSITVAQGEKVYWSGSAITKTSTDSYLGVCVAAGTDKIQVAINL